MFDQFRTTCPDCDGRLYVISMKVATRIPVEPDGFSTTDAEFFDTEDEVIECDTCGRLFGCGDLMLDEKESE